MMARTRTTRQTQQRPFFAASFSKFLQDVVAASNSPERIKGLGLEVDTAGGFLVPTEFGEGISLISRNFSIVRPRATVLPVTSDSRAIPTLFDSNHSTGNSPFSGVSMAWLADGESMTAIQPTIGQTLLIPKRLSGYTYVSNNLLSDSPLLPQLLTTVFGKAASYFEDKAFINGSGVAEPLGILGSGSLIRVNRSAASTIAIADIASLFTRLMPGSHNSPSLTFIASPTALAQLVLLGGAVITFEDVPRLMGVPLFISDSCPALGSVGDLILADLFYYVIGDRAQFSIQASSAVRFTTGETAFWLHERVDAHPWVDGKFTPQNGASTLSPFVTLFSATTGGD